MRYLTADMIYPLHRPPISKGVLVLNKSGRVVEILEDREGISNLEFYQGFLAPGFVNTHCHLELSHLLGKVSKNTGLPKFISSLSAQRAALDQAEIQEAIENADAEMQINGIVAVGDISNTSHTFFVKKNSKIFYHTFIEVFAIDPKKADIAFQKGLDLGHNCGTKFSITPHATYSVSDKLFKYIREHNNGEILSIHNQEGRTEDSLFQDRSGSLYNYLKAFGEFVPRKKSAIQFVLPQIPRTKTLLVHNTYTTKKDVEWATKQHHNLYWCTCPHANLYIEGLLPDYNNFINVKMTIGTDSLASNHRLCIWSEIKTLKENTNIDLNTLLTWGSKNGAEFLGLTHLGTFEEGKIPGVNNITNSGLKVIF